MSWVACGPSISTSGSTIGTMPASWHERGVARERVRIGVDAVPLGKPSAMVMTRAPLREARAELVVFGEALAQAVEALGDRLVSAADRRGAWRPCRP